MNQKYDENIKKENQIKSTFAGKKKTGGKKKQQVNIFKQQQRSNTNIQAPKDDRKDKGH